MSCSDLGIRRVFWQLSFKADGHHGIHTGVFNHIAERKNRITCCWARRFEAPGRRHHRHVGSFRAVVEIMPVDPKKT